jgi:DNA helicase-2/ATP-dependent DNA helicase PcrA
MLNQRQQEATEKTEGPLLILAGAGAGKTKTIVERIIHIIKSGTEPNNILAVTFTNKAAKEMRERVWHRLQEENLSEGKLPMIKTFHSLGMYILQEEYQEANLTKRLTIYDESDSMSTIKEIMEKFDVDPKMHEPRRIKSTISRLKGDVVDMNEYTQNAFSPFQKVVAKVWKQYEEELKSQKAVDFDDLILLTVKLLKQKSEIREKYQNKWKYIHIDEYQDTNASQYSLSKILAEKHKNICVVGDVDQNIYSWRGANLKNLLSFEEDFVRAKVVILEQNYRSTKTIIAAANEIIKLNKVRKEKNLFTENVEGEKISVQETYNDKFEAQYVASEIKKLLQKGKQASEIAILYRNNFQSRILEQSLLAEDIAYHLLGTRFFDRKEIRDVLSYLRLSENKNSVEDLKRALSYPTRGFGKVAMTKILTKQEEVLAKAQREKLQEFWDFINSIDEAKGDYTLSEIILKIVKDSGIEDILKSGGEEEFERLSNIYELINLAREYDNVNIEEALSRFMEESSLVSDQDTDTNETDKVKLMTIHASKGLEFKYVFIVGLENGLFPSDKKNFSKVSKEEEEEERRLFYVALTRAREKLFLSYALERMLWGKKQFQERSEFIDDIPSELLEEKKNSRFDYGESNFERIVRYL